MSYFLVIEVFEIITESLVHSWERARTWVRLKIRPLFMTSLNYDKYKFREKSRRFHMSGL
jgi:hypothetical protein